MVVQALKTIFIRDLNKLKTEIELYTDEKNLWLLDKGIANSAGNLCLHLIGNLNHFIGVGIAKSGYVRQRDLEFTLKDVPRADIIQNIEATIHMIEEGFSTLTEDEMNGEFPVVKWDKSNEMGFTLIHLATHLSYHLGQVNYHRRLLDS